MDHKIEGRDIRDGNFAWVQNELFWFFRPLIGSEACYLYQAMCYLIPKSQREEMFELTKRTIAKHAGYGTSTGTVGRKLPVLLALGMVQHVGYSATGALRYELPSLRSVMELGTEELKRRLRKMEGVPNGDTRETDEGMDADQEPFGEDAQEGAGSGDSQEMGVAGDWGDAVAPEGAEADGVPNGDTGANGEQNKAERGGVYRKRGVGVPERGGMCTGKGGFKSPLGTPFNKEEYKEKSNTPQPPKGGGGVGLPEQGQGSELVLPDPQVRPGESAWALNVGIAARWVLGQCGISVGKALERAIAAQLAHKVGINGNWLADAAMLMVIAWENYQRRVAASQLRFQWGVMAFFGEGYWDRATMWPWKDAPAAQEPGRVQHDADAAAKQKTADLVAQFAAADARADELAAKGMDELGDVIARLRGLRNVVAWNAELRELESELVRIEDEMIAVLVAHHGCAQAALEEVNRDLEKAPAGMTPRYQKLYRDELIAKRVTAACDVPRLTIFYRTTVG